MSSNHPIWLGDLWQRLTWPDSRIEDPARRRQAELLAGSLLVLIPSSLVITLVRVAFDSAFFSDRAYLPAVFILLLMAAYLLSRTRWATLGLWLAVISLLVVELVSTALLGDPNHSSLARGYLVVVVAAGSALLPPGGVVALMLAVVGSMMSLPLVAIGASWPALVRPVGSVVLVSLPLIAVSVLRQRDLALYQRKSREMSLLIRVSEAAETHLDPIEVLNVTCRELALALQVPQAGVALFDEEQSMATVAAEYRRDGGESGLGKIIPVDGNPATQYVLAHQASLAVAEAQTDPRMAPVHDLMAQRGVASILILPIIVAGRVVGTLGLDAYERRQFTGEDIELASSAVAVAARALEHAQLFEAERQSRQLAETLAEIAQELNLSPDLDTALSLVLARLEQVLAFDSGSILLLEEDQLRVVAIRGFQAPGLVLGAMLALDLAQFNRDVIESKRPLIVGSVLENPHWIESLHSSGLETQLDQINSWMGIPLLIQNRVIGMLTADKVEPNFYQARDAELALAFAGHAAVAIENARLLESERRQLRLAHTLQKVGALLTTRLGLDELFEQLFDLLAQVVSYDSVSVQLLDENGQLDLVAGRGFTDLERARRGARMAAGGNFLGRWREEQTVVMPSTHLDPRWIPFPGSDYIRSWIGAALVVKGRVVGVLNVDSETPNAYDDAIGETVTAFANQAAVAIENTRLFERGQIELAERRQVEKEHQRLLQDLARRNTQLQTAAEVSKSASTILAPVELMTQTVNLIKDRFDFYFVGLYLTDAAGNFAVLRAGTGKAGRKMLQSGQKLPVGGKSMIGWVVANTQLWLAQDAKAETNRFDNPLLPETRSELALPLVSRGRCIGGLTVQSAAPAAFSEVDVVSLQTMAEQLAVVIENARLYEDAQQEIVKRRQAEVEIKQLNENLEQRVVERTAELAAVNSELEAFVYSVSHDLRAPLRRVLSFADALQQDYSLELDDVAMDYLLRLETAGGQMTDLIDSLLNLSRLSRRELVRTPVDLGALAREVADALMQMHPDRPVEWVVADGMVVNGDPHLLRIVMENLIGNAWKFTGHCDHPRIKVGYEAKDGGEQAYFVRDNGAGFDMSYAEWLFTAFRRLHTVDEFEGTGIGLATVQRIVHRHGGRVWAEGAPGQGATFYFTL